MATGRDTLRNAAQLTLHFIIIGDTTLFKQHLLLVVTLGLADLAQAQEQGRVPKNGLSESHFFSVWVGQAIKTKRFDISVVSILKSWQQQARTSGAGADLKNIFSKLRNTYQVLSDLGECEYTQQDIITLIDKLTLAQWQVTSDVLISKKVSIKSHGVSSFVIAPTDLARGFDKAGNVHCFVRGDQQQFIDICYELGLLAFKATDYKSAVKFHGEFILNASNNYNQLPEIPSIYG